MGTSHARAYHRRPDEWEIVGLVARGAGSRQKLNAEFGGRYAGHDDFAAALARTKPDAVCLSTYTETHAPYALAAMEAGAHVFVEKPLAANLTDCDRVLAAAQRLRRKLMVGYILQVHPAWQKFTELARTLGRPLVMRMNLNQQSAGEKWATHQKLLRSTSPLVDCGVHYVDVMCRMSGSPPVSVTGLGARLTGEITPGQINYGHLQVKFADGSVGWYEAGWGPMMSETAFFVKDVIGPNGSVSIVAAQAASAGQSANIAAHTQTEALRLHHAVCGPDGQFARPDEIIAVADEPDHDELCAREQAAFLRAIRDEADLTGHWQGVRDSLRIVLAADQSIREGRTVQL
jgi:predicted dehydrogenase